uniref:Protein TIME FOR COFFEE n=1 Tax=Nelumbo nucifera TaxID=4432 RepID=A0A822YPW4_NELNU|nr:TPA_asm: hypothetical protein HUJ06_012492 [Nelumbo nucifera]
MDRNREARRGSLAATNGLSRRRQRSSSLRDSPEEDGSMELQETARLRDRVNKKDRDRDRSSRNKRRRGERLMHGSNREEGGEESTEESVDDDEEDEDEDAGAVRMLPPNPPSSSLSNHHHHRKSFPPAKVVRVAPTWKVPDEMSVPRKARSASAKRSHECWTSSGGGCGEPFHRQASTSPARPSAPVPSPASISPSSSNASVRKKMKPIGAKHRPPKITKTSSSSIQEIEIEVAEVLYGLKRQSQCPPNQEITANASQKVDSKETNGSNNEAKSRVSSPISVSVSAAAPQSSTLPQNSSTSSTPLPAVAPKRKRPRPVKFEEESGPANFPVRNGSISSAAAKVENEQPPKMDISSPKLEKMSGSTMENGAVSFDLGSSQAAAAVSSSEPLQSESNKPESNTNLESKPLTEESENRDAIQTRKEVPPPKKEFACSKFDVDLEDETATKSVSAGSEVESKREEKFKIDLMAPPPSKSSPERDGDADFVPDPNSMVPDVDVVHRVETTAIKAGEKGEKIVKQDTAENGLEDKKIEAMAEESEPLKPIANWERNLDLQLDLEKTDRESSSISNSKQQQQPQPQPQQVQKQPPPPPPSKSTRNDAKMEKPAQCTSLPMSMTVAGWPGGITSLGYMPPMQAVASMDGSSGSSMPSQPPHFLLSQPRPKRCATHCYIARNIYCHQQFTRMNPFWTAAAGSASLYGAKPYNLNVVPPTETAILGNPLQGTFPGRNLNPVPDKSQIAGTFSGHAAKDKNSVSAAPNFVDAQRKPLILQQAPQTAAAGNLLHGPAFIFPLSHQQAAATNRSGAAKSPTGTSNASSSSAANSVQGAPVSSASTAATTTTVSFNYPNLPANEAQYLAILQNNGYPFPIPTHVGAPPPFRGGTHTQAMPFFNGSFYSSQVLHPSQLQQQPHSQTQPNQQGHQNASTSSGSSSSQKHQQNQQRLQSSGSNGGGGNSNNFPASKNRPAQHPPQQQNLHVAPSHQARQLEADVGGEDSPSTADSRVSHAHKNLYGQNYALQFHPQNFALMTPAALGGAGGNGNHGEKQQQSQQQSLKGGVELLPSQPFAMSFASFNGASSSTGLDFSSMAQNHAIFHSLPDAARHGYQFAAAQVAQQKKNHQISEDAKTGDSSNADDERTALTGKSPAGAGQSLTFSRPDSTDQAVPTILGNTVVDSSRTLGLMSPPVNGNRTSRSNMTGSTAAAAVSNSQQQQQLIQLQKQQQQQMQQNQLQQHFAAAAAAARSKTSGASSGSIYSDHLASSSSVASKFSNALFSQPLIQSSSSAQSSQWKNSARTTTSPVTSQPLASTTTSSIKNLPQQPSRTQGHTQISFGVNPKSTNPQGGQQHPVNQAASPPVVVGSPPTSSISKTAGGSPRTTSAGGKTGPSPTLSSQQQAKNSPSGSSSKSSPVGGRSVPSILGNSHVATAPCSSAKPQPQLQPQQLQKQPLQQPQLFFTNAYMQTQSPQSVTTTTPAATATTATMGYYHQRQQQQQKGSSTASTGMLSLCPSLSLAGATTSDPAKAVAAAAAAAAANNMKGGMPPAGLIHAAQFAAQAAGNPHPLMSTTFPYMHAVQAVSVKPAEQKQPAGNDNLHACWQPERR